MSYRRIVLGHWRFEKKRARSTLFCACARLTQRFSRLNSITDTENSYNFIGIPFISHQSFSIQQTSPAHPPGAGETNTIELEPDIRLFPNKRANALYARVTLMPFEWSYIHREKNMKFSAQKVACFRWEGEGEVESQPPK